MPTSVRILDKGDNVSVAQLHEAVHSRWSKDLRLEIKASELKVYKSSDDVIGKQPLQAKDVLQEMHGSGSQNSPLIVVIPSVWYKVVEGDYRSVLERQDLAETALVDDLKSVVFSKWSCRLRKNIQAEDLQVFASEEALQSGDAELASSEEVHAIGTGMSAHPFIIVAPIKAAAEREEGSLSPEAKRQKTEPTSTFEKWWKAIVSIVEGLRGVTTPPRQMQSELLPSNQATTQPRQKQSKPLPLNQADCDPETRNLGPLKLVQFVPTVDPSFQWKAPGFNPAYSHSFCDLLDENALIDKSAALYHLLHDNFDYKEGDFRSVTLHVVYPRRFCKTTLLGFIEAVHSPSLKRETGW